MPVKLAPPDAAKILPIAGVKIGITEAGVRKANRRDLTVFSFASGTTVAGVFTKNQYCAAPVLICKQHLKNSAGIRAMLINTGCANAGTGDDGMVRAQATVTTLAASMGIKPEQVLPFSTGVIMEPLPVDRINAGIPKCVSALAENEWTNAAHAIMTTDTIAKACSRQVVIDGKTITVTGIGKGAGMIHPNMATMLSFVATDAAVSQGLLQRVLDDVVMDTFNAITIDGDTSTNDSLILAATGASGVTLVDETLNYAAFKQAVYEVCLELAHAIVRDGEGATKFITIAVENGPSREACHKIAKAIAHSPLVKTAMFASDPNLGRILAAMGYAGVAELDVSKVSMHIGHVHVVENGGRRADYVEADASAVMKEPEILIKLNLGIGNAKATVWTCDFSYDYVKINADYRS
jgi:glutamate N-acetyltransferase / amino-acid N-acetyltransferase